MSGRDGSHGKRFRASLPPEKSLVHSHRILKHRSVAYTMEQPSISGLWQMSIYSTKNVAAMYVYGVDTQASASKVSHVILEIITFQRETKSWR